MGHGSLRGQHKTLSNDIEIIRLVTYEQIMLFRQRLDGRSSLLDWPACWAKLKAHYGLE